LENFDFQKFNDVFLKNHILSNIKETKFFIAGNIDKNMALEISK